MKLFSLLFLILSTSASFAQTRISGKITDQRGFTLPGVNITVKGSYDGASTNAKGEYAFTTQEKGKQSLLISFLGYQSQEKEVELEGKDIVYNTSLKELVNELKTVTISAGSIEASDEKKAVMLRPLDIVTTAGANGDIYGALQTLPGVQTASQSEGLFVRGGDASEAKTIIDGLPVLHPYQSSVPDIAQRGRFSPFLFKNTVFSSGGYSAQYGQALSSTLTLESQDIAERVNSTNIAISSVGLGIGHQHRWSKTSAGVDVNYNNLAPYFSLFKPQVTYNSFPQSGGGSFILRHKTSKTGLLKFYGTQSFSDLSLNVPVDATGVIKTFKLRNSNTFINTSYKEVLSKKWSLYAAGSFSQNKDNRNIDNFDISTSDQAYQGKVMLTRSLGRRSMLRLGSEGQIAEYRNGSFQDYIYGYTGFKDTLKGKYGAAFAETDWFLSSSLVARIGGRYEYSSLVKKTNFAPRTSLALKTGDNSQVSFAYGSFYQDPNIYYLANASSALNYERADHYILNYQKIDDQRTFRVEAYYKNYSNLIKYDTLNAPFRLTNLNNNGSGYARGIDVFWRDKKTLRYVDYWVSYSFLDTKRDYQNFKTAVQPPYAAAHTFTVVLKKFFPKIMTNIGFTYTFATGRPYFNPNNNTPETFLSDRTPNYQSFSLNASYLTNIKGHFTVVALSVSNIFGIDNVFGYRYTSLTERYAITSPYPRFAFLGVFISIGKDEYQDE